MIKISIRDIKADLPNRLIRKILNDKAKAKANLINITGYENYTPEVLDKLKSLGYDVRKNGTGIKWYLNGEQHRAEGPAFENSEGSKAWYLNGKAYTEEYNEATK